LAETSIRSIKDINTRRSSLPDWQDADRCCRKIKRDWENVTLDNPNHRRRSFSSVQTGFASNNARPDESSGVWVSSGGWVGSRLELGLVWSRLELDFPQQSSLDFSTP